MSSDKSYCKPIDGNNYGVELSFQKELEKAIEEAIKENKPLILMGVRFSGKTTALKIAISKGIIKDPVPVIEISKDKIDEKEKEELKKLIKEEGFKIIEGTKYEIKYILSDETYQAGTDKSDESKLKEYLKKIFMKKTEGLKLPDGVIMVEANITEEEADKIFECYVEEYLKKQGNNAKTINVSDLINKKDHFIEMAYLGEKGKGIFIPQYLKRLIEEYAGKSEKDLESQKEKEKEIEKALLGFFGIELVDLFSYSSNFQNFLESLSPYLRSIIKNEPSLFLGSAGVMIVGLTLLSAFHGNDVDKGLDKYIEASRLWNELPQEKREALCSLLDEKFNLPPSSSCEFLSSWLSKDENEMRRQLNEIVNGVFSNIKEIEEDLDKLREELYASGAIRIKSEKELTEKFESTYAVAINEETIVGIGESDQDKEVTNKASEIINKASEKLVLIVGEPGAGKSTLLYIVGREFLKQGKRVYLIEDFDRFSFTDFSKLGDYAYAILDVTEKIDPKSVAEKILASFRTAHVIIATRPNFVETQEYFKKLKDRNYAEIYNIKMPESVLLEIAKRNLSSIGALTKEQVQQVASKLVEKSEGLPLYITEAVKKIFQEIGKRDVDDILNLPPERISALILKIIDSELDRSPHLLLLYYLVSHYPNFPEELISSAETLFNIPKPIYMNELPEEGTFTLHSWYKDITDLIFQGKFDELDFTKAKINKERFLEKVKDGQNSRFLKQNANDYIESIKETLSKKEMVLANLNKKIFDFIAHLGARVSLINLANATMLFLIFDAVGRELVNRDTGNGFLINRERVDPMKLDKDGYQFYNKLVGFLVNTYLDMKNLKEDELLNRPFYALSILYISRLLAGDLAERIDEEFLGEKEPSLKLIDIANSYINSSQPLRLYLSAFVSFLESIGYIKPQSEFKKDEFEKGKYEFEKGILSFCKGKFEEAIKEYDEAINLDPNNPLYHYNKGNALRELGRFKEALESVLVALKLSPGNPVYLITYAELEADLDSPEKGISKINESISSGVTDKDEICEEIDNELKEEVLNEKEKDVLLNIKNTICQNEGSYKND